MASFPRRAWTALRGRGPTGLQQTVLPHEAELVDGVNEVDLAPGLSTRFGYCPACKMVYPPEQTHECDGGV